MDRPPNSHGSFSTSSWTVGGLVGLVFLPLLLSGIEYYTTGSTYVEDACRALGIYDLLTRVYKPLFEAIFWLAKHLFG